MSPPPFDTSRRGFVHGLAGTTAALAATRSVRGQAQTALPAYTPVFFTSAEWAFLEAACERIYPADELGPGAIALGVAAFIDRQMDTPYGRGETWYLKGPFRQGPANLGYQLPLSPRALYRQGIERANAWCVATHGQIFANLAEADRIAVLTAFEAGTADFGDVPATAFFEQLRTNTLEGVFADPVHGGNRGMAGWTLLGFPGARADFMDWIDQNGAPYPFGPVSVSGETI